MAELKAEGVWNDVVLVVVSDFGRTLNSNGQGTDHAWGGNYLVMGGGVKGGQILGDYPSGLGDDSDCNIGNGVLLPTTPWEAMWQPIAEWMGADDAKLDFLLPNAANFPANTLISHDEMFASS